MNAAEIHTAKNGRKYVTYTLKQRRCCTFVPAAIGLESFWGWLAESLGVQNSLDLCRQVELGSLNSTVNGLAQVCCEQMRGAKAWVAAITGTDAKYGLRRRFVRASQYDLSRSGRGEITWTLGAGIYEASSTWRSMESHRTFFAVDSLGGIEILDGRDVLARI